MICFLFNVHKRDFIRNPGVILPFKCLFLSQKVPRLKKTRRYSRYSDSAKANQWVDYEVKDGHKDENQHRV